MATRNYVTARGLGPAGRDHVLYEVYFPYGNKEVLLVKLNSNRFPSDHFLVQGFVLGGSESTRSVESVPEDKRADLEKRIIELGFKGRIVFL